MAFKESVDKVQVKKVKTDRRNIKTAFLIPLAAGVNSWR
jgi:hypothetical protein